MSSQMGERSCTHLLKLGVMVLMTLAFSCKEEGKELTVSAKDTRPNIIWLMAEDISLDLECYGMKGVQTPNLNKMAAEGVRFDNCFVTNSICSPSRSAMLVGTHQTKINAHNHRSNREVPLHTDYKPFTYWLRKSGYTAVLGHHGVMDKGRKIDVNFKHKPLGPWDGQTKFGLFDKFDRFEETDQPFFAQIQLKVTHRGEWWSDVREKSEDKVDINEIELPPYYADHPAIRLDWAKYLDQIEYMDYEVGLIFKELEEKNMADNTIVIFIGDNGRCNIRGKGYLHDSGLRIPFIVYDPNSKLQGIVNTDVVSATDITATILDYAGINIPEYMTGQPIFSPDFDREQVYATRDLWDEILEKSRGITTDRWKYIRNDKPEIPFDAGQAYLEFYRPAVHVMRNLNEKGELNKTQEFFFLGQKPEEELYDLKEDAHELHNLATEEQFKEQLLAMRNRTREMDSLMQPVDSVFEPVIPRSVEVLQWVKSKKPELHKQMREGLEIGFKKTATAYQKAKK
ncbi:sulfatase [Ulvibacterium sp.]|uniref:sulfatase family protein n=1 Tax=Ulvibacterium sp. TaxID=2665914 RepID=UPI003BACCD3B